MSMEIGISKSKYINKDLDPAVIGYMKQIKKLFDPKGIFESRKNIFKKNEKTRKFFRKYI